MKFLICVLAVLVAAPACSRTGSSGTPEARTVLTLPSKDDIALVNGQAISLAYFSGLRDRLPRESVESLLWLAFSSVALQNQARSRGLDLSADACLNLARYAAGTLAPAAAEKDLRIYSGSIGKLPDPARLRQEIEGLLASSTIVRNPQVIAEFRGRN